MALVAAQRTVAGGDGDGAIGISRHDLHSAGHDDFAVRFKVTAIAAHHETRRRDDRQYAKLRSQFQHGVIPASRLGVG